MRSLVPSTTLDFGPHTIGVGHTPLLIAEIGINHNGDVKRAKDLIDLAHDGRCTCSQIQKRDLESIYTEGVRH